MQFEASYNNSRDAICGTAFRSEAYLEQAGSKLRITKLRFIGLCFSSKYGILFLYLLKQKKSSDPDTKCSRSAAPAPRQKGKVKEEG